VNEVNEMTATTSQRQIKRDVFKQHCYHSGQAAASQSLS